MHRLFILALVLATAAGAATLQKLSLDEMIAQSTDIVRAKVGASSASFRGSANRAGMIYTHYTLTVSERYKGTGSTSLDVAVPGGTAQGYRQVFSGAPTLNAGDEFVFFLWTSRTGLTQIIGLTQGLFTLTTSGTGAQMLKRSVSSEVMLDPATGKPVVDAGLAITVDELKRRIATLPAGKVSQ